MHLAVSTAMEAKAWMLSLLILAATAPLTANEMPVDSEQQCKVFKRIFTYDKHLRHSDRIVVLIVAQTTDGSDVVAVTEAFRNKGMYPAAVTVDSLTADLTATLTPQSTVVYVMPDVYYGAVDAFATGHGFLSISGLVSLADSGRVSVSVDMAGERPQVVVNIRRLTAEGHELSSELLRLARIIR